MAWNPDDATFALAASRIQARAKDEAAIAYRDRIAEEAERLAARGLLQSGAMLHGAAEIAKLPVDGHARVWTELLRLITDATGDPVELRRQEEGRDGVLESAAHGHS